MSQIITPSGPTNDVVVTSSALPTGAATETTLGTRLSESDFDTKTGSLTETAPSTDTASSGLNGRLQRIAQRLTSILTALGSPFQAGGSIGNTTFASTQSGTWTVQPGNTANTTAWKVDGSAVTQPVSYTTKPTYVASSNLTVTNLNSLASSQTWIAGWQGAAIDNSTNRYAQMRLTGKLTAASANNQAGTVLVYVVGQLDDSNWPINVSASEGTLTPTGGASVIQDVMRLVASLTIDNSASRIYYFDTGWFDFPSPKVVPFIAGNATTTTTAQFASSGNQVTLWQRYTVAA